MRPGRAALWLLTLLAAVALGPAAARGAEAGSAPSDGAAAGPAGASGKKKPRKRSTRKKTSPDTKVTRAKSTRPGKQKSASTINESVTLTPFPSHPAAAKKALAQNRRDELADAEKAARDVAQADRWQTVLFDLRNLDARSDPEGCFWRLVAYYRLGQIERARALRNTCDFVPKDAASIEAEDEQAAQLQPPTTVADQEAAEPVTNPAPYTGAGPAHVER